MTLRLLIVDDEPLALDRIKYALNDVTEFLVVGEAYSGAEAMRQAQVLKPDIVVLDIQMPNGSGIEVARQLQAVEDGPELIFATAFDSYAAEAFEIDASDYLLKPVRADRLLSALDRASRRIHARQAGVRIAELELVVQSLQQPSSSSATGFDTEIWAPRPGGLSRLAIDDIIWIEAARDYLLVHSVHRSYILRETMSGIGRRLNPALMLRAHRSAFVSKAKIEEILRYGRDGVSLTLTNGAIVRVGVSYRDAILSALGASVPNRRRYAEIDD